MDKFKPTLAGAIGIVLIVFASLFRLAYISGINSSLSYTGSLTGLTVGNIYYGVAIVISVILIITDLALRFPSVAKVISVISGFSLFEKLVEDQVKK